jgi:hypothetical protein
MIEAFLQTQTVSVALLLADPVKRYKESKHWHHMEQVKNGSFWQQTNRFFRLEFTAEDVRLQSRVFRWLSQK